MAQRLLSGIGKLGLGLAVAGGVVQTALYNGIYLDVPFRSEHDEQIFLVCINSIYD